MVVVCVDLDWDEGIGGGRRQHAATRRQACGEQVAWLYLIRSITTAPALVSIHANGVDVFCAMIELGFGLELAKVSLRRDVPTCSTVLG